MECGINPAGSSRALRLDPLSLPLSFHAHDARADGFVRQVTAAPGSRVELGARLFILEHPIAEAKLQVTQARVQQLQAKYAAEWVTDRIAAEVTRFELNHEQATLVREQYRDTQHIVTAASAGTFNAVRPQQDMVGRYVKEG